MSLIENLDWRADPEQVAPAIDHLITALRERKTTTYLGKPEGMAFAPADRLYQAQVAAVCGNLSRLTWAFGLGFVSVIVHRNDGDIGEGFWKYMVEALDRVDVPEPERAAWLTRERDRVFDNADQIIALLEFTKSQL